MRKKISTILTVVAVVALMVPLVWYGFPKMFADSIYPEVPGDVLGIVDECAGVFQIKRSLVLAMIAKESGFSQHAVSPTGAMGYTQLMPKTYSGLKSRVPEVANMGLPDDPYDARTNICLGVAHLAGLLGTYGGDERAALIAYNGGDAAARRYLAAGSAEGLVSETRAYAPKILAAEEYYRALYGEGSTGSSSGLSGPSFLPTGAGTGAVAVATPSPVSVAAKGSTQLTNSFWKAFINDFFKSFLST